MIDASEEFRRLLDSIASNYMWGAWGNDKEDVDLLIAAFENFAEK